MHMAEVHETESRAGGEGSAAARIARTYAEALMQVAEKSGDAVEIETELRGIVLDVFKKNPQIEKALTSPVVKRSAKAPVIERAFKENSSDLLFSFLNVLNSKDRLSLIRNVASAYSELLDERAKRLRVKVKSAIPLSADQTEKLKSAISQATGLEPVLVPTVDENLLGGMIVQVGDRVFDSSIRTRIDTIRNQLLARSSYEIQAGRDRFSTSG
jgi:F-type H+-transporting ATPase subunit delta